MSWLTKATFAALKAGRGVTPAVARELDAALATLNALPSLRAHQDSRIRILRIKSGRKQPFSTWRADPSHAYAFLWGTRSGLQANVGLWEDGIRVGYGFEPTGAMYGDPAEVLTWVDTTTGCLRRAGSASARVWQQIAAQNHDSIYVERADDFKSDEIKQVEVPAFLEQDFRWRFFGVFLGLEAGASTPRATDHHGAPEFINRFYEATLPFYEEVLRSAQLGKRT